MIGFIVDFKKTQLLQGREALSKLTVTDKVIVKLALHQIMTGHRTIKKSKREKKGHMEKFHFQWAKYRDTKFCMISKYPSLSLEFRTFSSTSDNLVINKTHNYGEKINLFKP